MGKVNKPLKEMKMSEIQDLIRAAVNKDYAAATDRFNDLMTDKISDALEQEKISLANSTFNGLDVEEIRDLESDDEEIEDEEFFEEEEEDDEE